MESAGKRHIRLRRVCRAGLAAARVPRLGFRFVFIVGGLGTRSRLERQPSGPFLRGPSLGP